MEQIFEMLKEVKADRKTDKEEMLARMDDNMKSYQEKAEADRKANQERMEADRRDLKEMMKIMDTNQTNTDAKLESLSDRIERHNWRYRQQTEHYFW
jgi:organic radical activating enzyme